VNRARNRCYDGWHVGVIHCRHSPSERHTVGVVGGDINQKIVSVLTKEYDLVRANMEFKNLAPADARRALEYKEVSAILIVILLTEISVDGAWSLPPKHESDSGSDPYRIRGSHRGECARLRKRRRAERHTAGAPGRRPHHIESLVLANKKLDSDLVASLTQSLLSARSDLERDSDSCAGHFFLDLGDMPAPLSRILIWTQLRRFFVPAANMGS
jgi:hypothetical protein